MKIILTIFLLALMPGVTIAESLTLQQCIQHGLAHNPEVKVYALAVDESEQDINQAWGGFLPTLSLNYSRTELSNSNSGERDTDYLDQNSDNFSVRLTQPLFTGFSGVATLKRARQSKVYRQGEFQYIQHQLIREISISFYDLIHAGKLADQWQESIERLEKQQLIAQAWVGQQLAPRLRLLEIKVELSNAQHQLIKARSGQAIAQSQLHEWLNLESQQSVVLNGDFNKDCRLPYDSLSGCVEYAKAHRPELELSRLNIEMAKQDSRMILARSLPQAQLDASWVDYQRDYDMATYPDDDRDYYSITFNVSMKLFQGGRNIFALRKQNITIDKLRTTHTKQLNAIEAEVKTRYHQLYEATARINNVEHALAEAREAYNLAVKSAQLGVASMNDLLDAELRLTRTGINLIDAKHAYQQSCVLLDYAVGNN